MGEMASFEGIYFAYLSAAEGYSALLFVLRNNRITGADVGGLQYSGSYVSRGPKLTGTISAVFPEGAKSITGFQQEKGSQRIDFNFELSFSDIGKGYLTLKTGIGEINASIHKLQELP